MAELILELLCEEIPEWMLEPAALHLREKIPALLKDLRLGDGQPALTVWHTPRRLALRAEGIALQQPDLDEVRTGPPFDRIRDGDGNFSRAAEGFAKKFGQSPEDLFDQDGKAALKVHHPGQAAALVLPAALQELLLAMPWPKVMRWGDNLGPFVRPVRSLLALFGEAGNLQVMPMNLFGVDASAATPGHRIFSAGEVTVDSWDGYREGLKNAQVLVNPAERSALISARLKEAAAEAGADLVEDPDLVDLVARQVEFPSVISGAFPEAFLELPREVVITVLREHQKFFCLQDKDGRLLPLFLNVIDAPADPDGLVKHANQGVTAARLKDALFFWQEDLKEGLAALAGKLDQVVYHRKLGSYADKVARVKALVGPLAEQLGADRAAAERAAALCKADLVSLMIGEKEMTDLQGQMGGFYAREEGEPEAVWRAMAGHYQPVGAEDSIPPTAEGKALALADKADTLAGMFGAGQKPSGSKDPFALRRAMLGILRIAVDSGLDIRGLFEAAAKAHGSIDLKVSGEELLDALMGFAVERFGFWLQDEGYPKNEVTAVLQGQNPDPKEVLSRLKALNGVRADQEEVFSALAAGAKRVRNILKDQDTAGLIRGFNAGHLQEPAEKDLHRAFTSSALNGGETDHTVRLQAMAGLRPHVDKFFDDVMVMCEDADLRQARLGLLATMLEAFDRTADLSCL